MLVAWQPGWNASRLAACTRGAILIPVALKEKALHMDNTMLWETEEKGVKTDLPCDLHMTQKDLEAPT